MFFEEFSRFLETSETSKDAGQLGVRYKGLILENKELIDGKRVLDLASHDGRWSFAALHNGASHVYGIEWKPRLTTKTLENFEHYKVPSDKYTFINGDIFDELPKFTEPVDVVFCFGVFYHIQHHMLLLERIAKLKPASHIIIDTNVSKIPKPVIELKNQRLGEHLLVGHPSREAVHKMLSAYGWTPKEFDWLSSGYLDAFDYKQYKLEKRITVTGSR